MNTSRGQNWFRLFLVDFVLFFSYFQREDAGAQNVSRRRQQMASTAAVEVFQCTCVSQRCFSFSLKKKGKKRKQQRWQQTNNKKIKQQQRVFFSPFRFGFFFVGVCVCVSLSIRFILLGGFFLFFFRFVRFSPPPRACAVERGNVGIETRKKTHTHHTRKRKTMQTEQHNFKNRGIIRGPNGWGGGDIKREREKEKNGGWILLFMLLFFTVKRRNKAPAQNEHTHTHTHTLNLKTGPTGQKVAVVCNGLLGWPVPSSRRRITENS